MCLSCSSSPNQKNKKQINEQDGDMKESQNDTTQERSKDMSIGLLR